MMVPAHWHHRYKTWLFVQPISKHGYCMTWFKCQSRLSQTSWTVKWTFYHGTHRFFLQWKKTSRVSWFWPQNPHQNVIRAFESSLTWHMKDAVLLPFTVLCVLWGLFRKLLTFWCGFWGQNQPDARSLISLKKESMWGVGQIPTSSVCVAERRAIPWYSQFYDLDWGRIPLTFQIQFQLFFFSRLFLLVFTSGS